MNTSASRSSGIVTSSSSDGQRLQPCEQLGLAPEHPLAPDAVDGAVSCRGDDPGTRIARHAVTRPALGCDGERILHRVLGQLEVAEDADEDGDGTSPFLPVDVREVSQAASP